MIVLAGLQSGRTTADYWPSEFQNAPNQQHAHDGAAADAVHSSSAPITGYTNATPFRVVLPNHFPIASSLAKTLTWVDVADFLACVDVDPNGFHRIAAEGQDGHLLPSQFSLLLNLNQTLLQAFKLRTDLRFHGVL
jgi:hypothetical protein